MVPSRVSPATVQIYRHLKSSFVRGSFIELAWLSFSSVSSSPLLLVILHRWQLGTVRSSRSWSRRSKTNLLLNSQPRSIYWETKSNKPYQVSDAPSCYLSRGILLSNNGMSLSVKRIRRTKNNQQSWGCHIRGVDLLLGSVSRNLYVYPKPSTSFRGLALGIQYLESAYTVRVIYLKQRHFNYWSVIKNDSFVLWI